MLKFKRNDKVLVLIGRDKGKVGKVLKVFFSRKKNFRKLLIEGLNLVKKCVKADPRVNKQGAILEKESYVDYSNVVLVNKFGKKMGRIGFKLEKGIDRNKYRIFKKTKESVV